MVLIFVISATKHRRHQWAIELLIDAVPESADSYKPNEDELGVQKHK
jgi:hypothetical protein